MHTPLKILKEYWGFDSFREPQEEIITAVLDNKNTIALLPTGGGKSICFQIPTLLKEGICIVISPLIALMEDQVTNLKEKGIKAMVIPSGTSQDDIITLFDNIRFGKYKFLYVSPERLQSKFIQDKILQLEVSLIAIDEAHCISEWGHDFRPSYQKIAILKELHPTAPIIALTATATPKVLKDISNTLNLETPSIFKKSFHRNNLAYQIYFTEDKLYKLHQIFTKTKAPAIVYVNTRNKTKEISAYLNANGFKSGFYHGGLSSIEKKMAFENWMAEETPIIVTTNAFGMGIDKPNVKVVVHYNLPNSVENYVQEAGRGGRNGQKAFAVVLTNNADILSTKEMQEKALPSLHEIKQIHLKLYQHFQIAKGEFIEEGFDFNLLDFCNKYTFIPNKTFNGLQILHNNGIIQFNNNSQQKSNIQFLVNSSRILQYIQLYPQKKDFINTLLRLYGGVFDKAITIDEFFLGKKCGITSWKVIEYLEKLEEDALISYTKSNNNAELFFLSPREDDKTINPITNNIKSYLQQKHSKIEELIRFIKNDAVCRSLQVLNYFGEKKNTPCGICDVCLEQKAVLKNAIKEILQLLQQHKQLSSKEIVAQLPFKEADILINLRNLLSEEKIGINNYNKYFLI